MKNIISPFFNKGGKRFKETACATTVLDIHVSCDGDNKRKHQNKTKKGKKKLSFGHLTLIKISREDKLRHLKWYVIDNYHKMILINSRSNTNNLIELLFTC